MISVFSNKPGKQYAPVSGTIREINEKLNDKPGLLNKSPEEEGMLVYQSMGSKLDFSSVCITRMALQD